MAADPVVQSALRLVLAALLLLAASHKLRDRAGFRAALAGYELLPARRLGAVAAGVPICELGIASALLLPATGAVAALAAALLFALYAAAIAVNLRRGRTQIDCGCAGPGGSRPISAGLVMRNAVLVVAAGCAALPAVSRPLVWMDGLTALAASLALLVLYAAADVCIANTPRLRALRGSP